MAFIQQNVPQPNRVHTFSVRDFRGGLNNRSALLQNHEASSVLNMDYTTDEVLEKRKGQTYYDEYVTPEAVDFLFEYKPYNSNDVLFRCTPAGLYVNDDKIHDVEGSISAINHQGYMVFSDGGRLYAYGHFPQSGDTYVNIIGTAVDEFLFMEIVLFSVHC